MKFRPGLLTASSMLFFGSAIAGPLDTDLEPVAIVELGGGASRTLGGGSSFGADIAAEITPIENWLELEAGVTPLFSRNSTEWDTDLLFKKPWTLSKSVELMAGAGPEWVHLTQNRRTADALAAEAVVDLMFWPAAGKRRFGWYLEPSYDYTLGSRHERSIGVTAGLLIAIR